MICQMSMSNYFEIREMAPTKENLALSHAGQWFPGYKSSQGLLFKKYKSFSRGGPLVDYFDYSRLEAKWLKISLIDT
jgi:hypothetical protein